MKRWFVVCALLVSASAFASGIDGMGRISVGGGFRWVPNWWFQEHAAAAGTPMLPSIEGGPQGTASFGLGVSSLLEVSIDLLFGYQGFSLGQPDGGQNDFTVITAGGVLGGRLVGTDVLFKGFMLYLGVGAGPMLAAITSQSLKVPERSVLGLSVSGGATYRFADRYGITLEVRYLNGRSTVPDISGINVGGVWFSAMFTIFIPPSLKRDLDVPGF